MSGEATKPDTISEEEYGRWLTPKQAVERVGYATNEWNTVHRSILRRAASGRIRVHAEDIEWKRGGKSGTFFKYCAIPKSVLNQWNESENPGYLLFWKDGDAECEVRTGYSLSDAPYKWEIYGIRFDPSGLDKLAGNALNKPLTAPIPIAAAPVLSEPEERSVPNRAGRPPKDFWEDLVIAATRAILYDDTLKPKTQADVQRWMADWAIKNGHGHPGETALKERARKVYLACRE